MTDRVNSQSDYPYDRYFRAVNYLAAAQVYLRDNALLREPLKTEHIKPRLLGHWGTCPGINLCYLHLNALIRRTDANILLLTGPGHGSAANLANMYVEGSLAQFYTDLTADRAGVSEFVKRFSWPGGFPSHLTPMLPGVIHEGGELGYALATAFGSVLDNPDLITACIIGDGEAETGPTAGAWHGTKFLNPANDGAVLPILHLNGFKIANPTLFESMTDEELTKLFEGNGYRVHIVQDLQAIHEEFARVLDTAHGEIRAIQKAARDGQPVVRPAWPMIILRTPKGWTGPKSQNGVAMEGSFHSHQVPAKNAARDKNDLKVLEDWLRSYKPEELFDENGAIQQDIREACPQGDKQMAMVPHARGWERRIPLTLPSVEEHGVTKLDRGSQLGSMNQLGGYLAEVVTKNESRSNFRVVCPDELLSNRLGKILEVTNRQYNWPINENAEMTAPEGRVFEILNEHMCQGWLQGYLLTGRHGLFPCYEAFLPIVDGMMNQYVKFLKSAQEISWRGPISSLNYILSSTGWRQDHNGYSHQGPGFINNLLTKKGHTYRVYLPPDANSLLWTMAHCLEGTNRINLIVAEKQLLPQWLTVEEAESHCRAGASTWRWASTNDGEDPQVVLAGCGDSVHVEVMAAAQILREKVPNWRVRVVNVTDLQRLGIPQKYPDGFDENRFQRLFPLDVPVVFNFHGYTAAIKQLCWERPQQERFDLNGYREEGTTTTPFDMHIRNRTSRFHVVIQAAQYIAANEPSVSVEADDLIQFCKTAMRKHAQYILENGNDHEAIENWAWKFD